MASILINSASHAFRSIQTPVVYEQANGPKYPELEVILAPSTDVALPTYSSGRILAKYGSDAPLPALVGTYVNYDPASAVDSQKIPVAVLSSEFAQGLTGVDTTSTATATATLNQVNVAPLAAGIILYLNSLVNANEGAVITAFESYFTIITLESIMMGQTSCPLISIQGVA